MNRHRTGGDVSADMSMFTDYECPTGLDVPSTSPSISSSLRAVTSPLIETPLDKTAPVRATGVAAIGRSGEAVGGLGGAGVVGGVAVSGFLLD
jgi:hypothetical protein